MRILTEDQWAELVKRLQGQGGCRVHITHMPKNLTSHKLAWDFYDLLLQPSWQVEEPCPMKLLSSDEVQVGVADCANPPRSAQLLHDAFTAVGVRTPGYLVRGHGVSVDRCCLMVGTGDRRPKRGTKDRWGRYGGLHLNPTTLTVSR
jgi:hypothetical protein